MQQPPDYITPEVRALIGKVSQRLPACHPVEASEVRRFHQAIMDPAPRYFDDAAAARYGGPVAPPIYPVFAFRRAPDGPDPLSPLADDPDFDGLDRALRDLPLVPVPLKRLLNGGYEYSFYRYARVGDVVYRQSKYSDIYQKNGRGGAMVFVVIDDVYTVENGERLVESTNTLILR